MTANKNPAQAEFGNALGGYFAKEFTNYIQIFSPNKQEFIRVFKKSTTDAVDKCRVIVGILNTEYNAEGELLELNQKLQDNNIALNAEIAELKLLNYSNSGGGNSELTERRMEQKFLDRQLTYLQKEVTWLRCVIADLVSK